MRALVKNSKNKLARYKKNLKKNLKKRLALSAINMMLAVSMIASSNPITVVKAQEVVPIVAPEQSETVVSDFSLIHIVHIDKVELAQIADNSKPVVAKSKPNFYTLANRYEYGQCTYYVKSKRADIPNLPGKFSHARTWLKDAKTFGFDTGSEARIGAIMVMDVGPYGHVAIVEGFKNGKIEISEMNWVPKAFSRRLIDAKDASVMGYIY